MDSYDDADEHKDAKGYDDEHKDAKKEGPPVSEGPWDPVSDAEDRLILKPISAGELLRAAPTEHKYILPGLIREAHNTVIFAPYELFDDAQKYGLLITHSVAGGISLPPFGKPAPAEALLVIGHGNRLLAHERIWMLNERFPHPEVRRRIEQNLFVTQRNRKPGLYLNERDGQQNFMRSLRATCRLAVFVDADNWVMPKKRDSREYRAIGHLHSDLNACGIATLSFVFRWKNDLERIENEFLFDGSTIVVELTKDPAAPREFGCGFNVNRRRISEHDPVPLHFQVWSNIVNGKLEFGWQYRDPEDTTTAKQVEMADRCRRVAEMHARGMQQKDIAAYLGVDPATICRDLSKVKARGGKGGKGGEEQYD